VAAASLAGVIAVISARPPIAPAPAYHFTLPYDAALVGNGNLALAPDGSRLYFHRDFDGESQLYVHDFGTGSLSPVSGATRARSIVMSPDGRSLALMTAESRVQRYSLADGTVGDLGQLLEVRLSAGYSWLSARELVFAGPAGGLVTSAGAEVTPWPTRARWPEGVTATAPAGVAGTRAVLYVATGPGARGPRIEALRDDATEAHVVVDNARAPVVTAGGHLLFVRPDGTTMVAPFDSSTLTVTGPAAVALPNVGVFFDRMRLAVAANGVAAYGGPVRAQLVWVDRTGRESPAGPDGSGALSVRLDPSGRLIAVDREGSVGIVDLDRDTESRVAPAAAGNANPVWTPDGQILFTAGSRLVRATVQGGLQDDVFSGPGLVYAGSVSRDGRFLVTTAISADRRADVHCITLKDMTARPLVATPAYEGGPDLSPDGRFVAYTSDESGRREVNVVSFPDGKAKWRVSSGGGTHARWSRDGRELFYRNGDQMWRVPVQRSPTFVAGRPELLFTGAYSYGASVTRANYDIGPDGRFLMVKILNRVGNLHVIVNWFTELDAKIAAARAAR
jgi:hypothetical protein